MDYISAIKLLTSNKNFYIDLSLDRIKKVLETFGNPQDSLKCIHVAGTNGKGSVCAMLESVLRETGYKTGLYTSPHIWDYTERIKINGVDISKEKFAEYIQKIVNTGIHLTEFEILTVMAFLYFYDEKADIVILETGLGGRLDATNVMNKNLCSVITQIDLDHTDRLGNTKDKIAFEKAGIIKPDCPVITSMGYEVIKDRADECNSLFILTAPYADREYVEALSLKGQHQIENLALVLTTIDLLFKNIKKETILEGLRKVKHPCRFQYIKEKNMIVDASHNPNGIMALRTNLDNYYPRIERRFVFGALKTKDYERMMNILFSKGDEVYLYGFDYPSACSFEELNEKCPIPACEYTTDVKLTEDKLNIICGSFYMIGKMRDVILL